MTEIESVELCGWLWRRMSLLNEDDLEEMKYRLHDMQYHKYYFARDNVAILKCRSLCPACEYIVQKYERNIEGENCKYCPLYELWPKFPLRYNCESEPSPFFACRYAVTSGDWPGYRKQAGIIADFCDKKAEALRGIQ